MRKKRYIIKKDSIIFLNKILKSINKIKISNSK